MRKPSNPVLVLVITLPLLAVVGSFVSLALAVTRGDSELPKDYHWEGGALERDEALQSRASRLHVAGTIGFDQATQRCTVVLHGAASATAPATLRLTLTHPTVTNLDRHVLLHPSGDRYAAPCTAPPDAHWWLELADEQDGWLLRGRAHGDLREPVQVGKP
jgi:hypothetical protein